MNIFTKLSTGLVKGLLGLLLLWSASANAQVLINEDFSTANGFTPPANWLNEDAGGSSAQIWAFDNPGNWDITGGTPGFSGQFAIIDSDYGGAGEDQNTYLTTPAFDASTPATYILEFDDNWEECCDAIGVVEVFNGTTWTTVFSEPITGDGDGYENPSMHRYINISSATGNFNAAKVRFHYQGEWDYWWAIDNVKITRLNCVAPTATFSIVPDCNNNQFSVNATVTSMGSATSLSLSNGVSTYGPSITTVGTYVAGPFASNVPQNITLIHNDATCNVSQAMTFNCSLMNDYCEYALNVPVGNGLATTAVVSTTVSCNVENNMQAPSCGDELANDIWFKVTVPNSGNVTIQSAAVSADAGTDVVMEAYTGTCGNLTSIACDDDGNPDGFPSSAHSRIALTGQAPGATIYVRITPYDEYEYGPVAMTAWDPVMPVIATTGICDAAIAVTIDSVSGNLYRWVPILNATGQVIAQIYPNGETLGIVNAGLYINSGPVRQASGVYYLDRNVSITPAIQPAINGAVLVRLYVLNSELGALTNMDPAVTSFANLNISKSQEGCQSAVNAATVQIMQNQNGAFTDGAANSAGYVQFNTASFSSFYLRGGSTPLPVTLQSINAKNMGSSNQIEWATLSETLTDGFELERSADGRTFALLAKIVTTGKPYSYSYMDNKPFSGDNYYRLKLISKDGRTAYSTTVKARVAEGTGFDLYAYPNPVNKSLTIKVWGSENGVLSITDISGKVVLTKVINGSESAIDFSRMASGVYFIRYTDGEFSKTIKIARQ